MFTHENAQKQKNLKKISTFTCPVLLHITRQQPSGSLKGLLSGQEKVHVTVYMNRNFLAH